MRFTPQFLDELRARLPVSEVVGRRVKLQKAGREWKGLSPFNKEKTPSFFVNDQKQACFTTSPPARTATSSTSSWRPRACTFPEAVERLAQMAGVPLPKFSKEEEARDEKRKTLHDVDGACGEILRGDAGRRAAAPRRAAISPTAALEAATQLKFRLGYAPAERFALKEHLGAQGVPVEDMVEAGLLIARRRHSGALRSLPRPRDVSDHRLPRPHHRLRRPRAVDRTRRRNISTRRRRRSFTRARTSTTARPRARPRMTARR